MRGTGILHDLSQKEPSALHAGVSWNSMAGDSEHPMLASSDLLLLNAVIAGSSSRLVSNSKSLRISFSDLVTSYAADGCESCATHFWYSEAPSAARV